ncbi:ssrA-binding protein [Candidatus Phytoplasma oryzae]|uniref:SsrA-binding protein n=1 Tax=Candidatus Phytoplasma oryzae TaxID=203274 RepID=A0A139JQ92_9MOLU|nr:SsrA-binding protein SmpB [Candidatus Phytoplasma oryzae]KXT29129.1 ssrA-binding protein [Candidatus Phytoplasma oryzae]RAM57553.1 single-stranded DNA-binding protein [Candidatus Phytoplasma oryzae]
MIKTIITNKKIFYNYFLEKKYVAGIKLLGHEVKSIRLGKVTLDNAYIKIKNNEIFILNMLVSKYNLNNFFYDYDEKRPKKLLLKKKEILKINSQMKIKGFVVVPTKIFIYKNLLKLEIFLAKGKKRFDKKKVLKEKEIELKIKKMIKKDTYY